MGNVQSTSPSKKEWVTFDKWAEFYELPQSICDQLRKYPIGRVSGLTKLREGDEWYFDAETTEEVHGESTAYKIILLWHGAPKSGEFVYLITQILQMQQAGKHPVMVINDKFRRRYQNIPPEIPVVTPFPENRLSPPKKAFRKANLYQTLQRLMAKLPDLPLKPKGIYGYGSFFREKDVIGDLDLYVELDPEQSEWKEFDSFFSGKFDEHKEAVYDQFVGEMLSEQDRSRNESGGRAKSVKTMCEDPAFQQKIAKFNLNLDFIRFCDWSELIGRDASGFPRFPELQAVFQRMWKGRARGIEVHTDKWTMDTDTPRVLLWSPDTTDIQKNYATWEGHKTAFIVATYKHMVRHIEKLIKYYEEQEGSVFEKYKPVHAATIAALKQLQDRFPLDVEIYTTYEVLSKKINSLRDLIKEIRENNGRELKWTEVRA